MASEFAQFAELTNRLASVSDWQDTGHQTGEAPTFAPEYQRGLVALTGEELLQRDFPPRENILAPWLPTQGLTLLYAERGIGKTWTALNCAYAVACGGSFLRWKAPKPRRVVYIDGEMPARDLKQRFASIVEANENEAPEGFVRFVAADLQRDGLPDLADAGAQRFYDRVIQDADLIVVDNLSTVCRSLRENEADSWAPVQAWCLRQRAAGRSVLLVHHAGKSGGQRGTSRKEDVLDAVISLRRPPDYIASQGARFEVHFTKNRGFLGEEAAPFEAHLIEGQWIVGELQRDGDDDTIRSLKAQGFSLRSIAKETGIPRSTVARKLHGGDE